MPTRRRFLESSALALAGACAPRVLGAAASDSFDPWVEVHAGNLAANVGAMSRHVGGRPILAVIKNNGYGGGVATIGRLLEKSPGVGGLAVVKMQEAIALRDAGVRAPVLMMGPFTARELDELAARGVTPMVYTDIGADADALAAKRQAPLPIHVCVDTGIGRVGVPYRQASALIRSLAARRSTRLEGTMMTFAEDRSFDREQLERFQALCEELGGSGVNPGRRHAASSYALFQHTDSFLDMVRPGMAIYGIYPEQEFRADTRLALTPALALRCRVAYVKALEPGESAGYNRAYVAARRTWVATLPVGHADGWPRAAAKGARVRIGGRLYPVVASVSASHTIVEIGAARTVNAGDEATLFDWQDGSRPEDVAAACGASVYDLTMHLNPLMPRLLV
jgi:alanine racemase